MSRTNSNRSFTKNLSPLKRFFKAVIIFLTLLNESDAFPSKIKSTLNPQQNAVESGEIIAENKNGIKDFNSKHKLQSKTRWERSLSDTGNDEGGRSQSFDKLSYPEFNQFFRNVLADSDETRADDEGDLLHGDVQIQHDLGRKSSGGGPIGMLKFNDNVHNKEYQPLNIGGREGKPETYRSASRPYHRTFGNLLFQNKDLYDDIEDTGPSYSTLRETGPETDVQELVMDNFQKSRILSEDLDALLNELKAAQRVNPLPWKPNTNARLDSEQTFPKLPKTPRMKRLQNSFKVNKRHCWNVADVCCMWNICESPNAVQK